MQVEVRVCNQCNGVIPSGAEMIAGFSGTLQLSTGPQVFTALDFCCTEHLAAYVQTQPVVPVPSPAYPTLPAH